MRIKQVLGGRGARAPFFAGSWHDDRFKRFQVQGPPRGERLLIGQQRRSQTLRRFGIAAGEFIHGTMLYPEKYPMSGVWFSSTRVARGTVLLLSRRCIAVVSDTSSVH
jgi:hypothetical protein